MSNRAGISGFLAPKVLWVGLLAAAGAAAAACGAAPGGPTGGAAYSGACTATGARGQLAFAPSRGRAGPAFVIAITAGPGDYDAQVNAVDSAGRYGPDARGTVHLDGSGRTGTLQTPDLQSPSGATLRYSGRWSCATFTNAAPVPEPSGGPSTPR